MTAIECDWSKFEALEGKARRLPFAFVREELFHESSISLLHRDMRDPIPVARTLWTMPFVDKVSRDRMCLWMHERLDLWTTWGEVAKDIGAHAMTQALLALLMLEPGGVGDASVGALAVIRIELGGSPTLISLLKRTRPAIAYRHDVPLPRVAQARSARHNVKWAIGGMRYATDSSVEDQAFPGDRPTGVGTWQWYQWTDWSRGFW